MVFLLLHIEIKIVKAKILLQVLNEESRLYILHSYFWTCRTNTGLAMLSKWGISSFIWRQSIHYHNHYLINSNYTVHRIIIIVILTNSHTDQQSHFHSHTVTLAVKKSCRHTFIKSNCCTNCHTVTLSYWHTTILTHCHTVQQVIQSHCPTISQSHGHTVQQSYCHTVILSNSLTVTLSYCPTVLLSHCHAVQQSYCHRCGSLGAEAPPSGLRYICIHMYRYSYTNAYY